MRVGVIVPLTPEVDKSFADLREMGMESCQLVCWKEELMTEAMAQEILRASEARGVTISAFWCGWGGPVVWNFYEGQETLGLVPVAFRDSRMQTLLHGVDFAHRLGVRDMVTHVGFMPENPHDPNYQGVLAALRPITDKCRALGMRFLFETGQETPVTLLRAMQDLEGGKAAAGAHWVGVNLDPANLLLYGKGNPLDALEVFGEYVMGVHAKDGFYPTDGRELGREVPVGAGLVNFPRLLAKLHALGYDGDLTIEREIEGEEQRRDIAAARDFLRGELKKLGALS